MLRTRVKPSSKARFEEAAKAAGLSPSDALRQAAIEWIQRQEAKK